MDIFSSYKLKVPFWNFLFLELLKTMAPLEFNWLENNECTLLSKLYMTFQRIKHSQIFFSLYLWKLMKVSCQKQPLEDVLKTSCFQKFAKLARKHLCHNLSSLELQALGLQLYKKVALINVLFCELCKFFKNLFLFSCPNNFYRVALGKSTEKQLKWYPLRTHLYVYWPLEWHGLP